MNFLDRIVEQKIAEAVARGELTDLPGEGAPLAADIDPLIPQELRMAYRVLRNAGLVPPEVQALREIGDLERRIDGLLDARGRGKALRKLQLLRARLEASGRFHSVLSGRSAYSEKLLERLQHGIGQRSPQSCDEAGTASHPDQTDSGTALRAQP